LKRPELSLGGGGTGVVKERNISRKSVKRPKLLNDGDQELTGAKATANEREMYGWDKKNKNWFRKGGSEVEKRKKGGYSNSA